MNPKDCIYILGIGSISRSCMLYNASIMLNSYIYALSVDFMLNYTYNK